MENNALPAPTTPTLSRILTAQSDHERLTETMCDVDLVPPADLFIEDLKNKIDNLYGFRCALENAGDAMDARIKRMKEARDAVANNLKRLDALLIFNMQKHGFEKLPGNDVRAQLQYTQVCEPNTPAPQLSDCVEWGPYIRTKYEWDKTAIKNASKDGKDLSAIASVSKNPHVRFYPTAKVLEGKK